MKRKGQWRKLCYGLTGMAALLGMLSGHALAAESMENMSTGDKTAYTTQVLEESAEEEINAAGDVKINATNFPDEKFRSFVAKYDKDNNKILSKEERESVKEMKLFWNGCESLKGIEFFPMLQELNLYGNEIKDLNISQNTELRSVDIRTVALSSLDLSNNKKLNYLEIFCADDTVFTSLDLSQCAELKTLYLHSMKLDAIDLSACTKLNSLTISSSSLTNLDVSKLTMLIELKLMNNKLQSVDVSKNINLTSLDLSHNQLTQLNVSKNVNLTTLYVTGNQLTQMDVSKNVAMKILNVSENQLTQLDVSKNTSLEYLNINENQLSKIDVSKCVELGSLYALNNNMPELSLEMNPKLRVLHCGGKNFSYLDLSNNASLVDLKISRGLLTTLDLEVCPNLVSIYIYNTRLKSLDLGVQSNLKTFKCSSNGQLSGTLDLRASSNLTEVDCNDSKFTKLLLPENGALKDIRCENNELSSLTLKNLEQLRVLDCGFNRLTKLEISGCDNLEHIKFGSNKIASFDFGAFPNLEYVHCSYNPLESMDFSKNPELTTLDCRGVNMFHIDLSKNIKLESFFSGYTCRLALRTNEDGTDYYDLKDLPELDVNKIVSLSKGKLVGTYIDFSEATVGREITIYYASGVEGKPAEINLKANKNEDKDYEIKDGILYLYFEHGMPDYSKEEGNRAPWYAQRKNITEVQFPIRSASDRHLGDYALYGCTNLKKAELQGATSIGKHAFDGCTSLEEVTLGKGGFISLYIVGEYAFNNNTSLKKFKMPGDNQYYDVCVRMEKNAFWGCSSMEEVVMPTRLWFNSIFENEASNPFSFSPKKGIFKNDEDAEAGIKEFVIPEGATEIKQYAFLNMRDLEKIIIPDTVNYIGDYALCGTGCESFDLPEGLAWVGKGAFSSSPKLKEINLSDSVYHVGEAAFEYNSSLEKVVLGKSVQELGGYVNKNEVLGNVFSGCSSLRELVFAGKCPERIEPNLLDGVTATAWYPGGEWTAAQRTNCGGNITWKNVSKIAITKQPEKVNAKVGEKVTFHIEASGYEPSYQWQYSLNGGNTWKTPASESAKTPDFSFTVAERHVNLLAKCIVTPYAGGTPVTSDMAELIVGTPIVITKQPVKATVVEGEAVNFQITATGDQLSYQWQYSRDNGTTWTNPGAATESAKTANYKFTAAPKWDGFKVRCILTDGIGKTLISDVVSLKITPLITTQPVDVSVKEGEKATFQIVLANENWTYQWMYSSDKGTTWKASAAASAKTASYNITTKVSHNGWLVKCVLTNEKGTQIESDTAKLAVAEIPLVITTQPSGKTATEGDAVTFKVVATGRDITYQWMSSKDAGKTWTALAAQSATTATYKVTTKLAYNGYLFKCVLTDAKGTKLETKAVKLVVNAAPPVITTQPKAVTAVEGTYATFKIVATGTGLTYQWQYSQDNGTTWNNSGAASGVTATYVLGAKTSRNGYLIRCKVTDANGKTVISNAVKLTVTSVGPTITTQPTAVTAVEGTYATFKIVATGTGLTYQWQYSQNNGSTWINSGAVSSVTDTYMLGSKTSRNGYLIRCKVTDANGKTVISNAVKLTVTSVGPTITTQPTAVTAVEGTYATFKIVATGTGLTYQWQYSQNNGSTWINSGAVSSVTDTYMLGAKESRNGYMIRCIVKDASGNTTTSNAVKLTVTAVK